MARTRDAAALDRYLQRPRNVQVPTAALPPGLRAPGPGFVGAIKIHDGDRSRRFVKFIGEFVCNVCGGEGAQTITYWRDVWPKGVTDEQVQNDMKLCVEQNHTHRGRA